MTTAKANQQQYGLKFELQKLIEKFRNAKTGKDWDDTVGDLQALRHSEYLAENEKDKLGIIFWSSRCAERNFVILSLELLIDSLDKETLAQELYDLKKQGFNPRVGEYRVGKRRFVSFIFNKNAVAETVVNAFLEKNLDYGVIADVDGCIYVAKNDDIGSLTNDLI